MASSAEARRQASAVLRSPMAIAAALTLLAAWLSLGPTPQSRGQILQLPPLYALLYDYVPGFSGLRVPARYAMVAGVFLSILAGGGAAVLIRRAKSGAWMTAAIARLVSRRGIIRADAGQSVVGRSRH